MVIDSIGNFISNLRNASVSGKATMTIPHSKVKMAIADVLEKEGFIKNLTKKSKTPIKDIEIEIVYSSNGTPKLKGVERVSRPSKRIYRSSSHLEPVKNGFGHIIISTSKGVMTGKDARKEHLGGEVLFKVW